MTNAILVLDILAGLLELSSELQALLSKAQSEGRDVTQEELDSIRVKNRDKASEFLSE